MLLEDAIIAYTCQKIGCEKIFFKKTDFCFSCHSRSMIPFYDYFKLLGLSKDFSFGELSSAYKKLSLKYHPDTNLGDGDHSENFLAISRAYEVLKNKQTKDDYFNLYDRVFFRKNQEKKSFYQEAQQSSEYDFTNNFETIFKRGGFRPYTAAQKLKKASSVASFLGAFLGFVIGILMLRPLVVPLVVLGYFLGRMSPQLVVMFIKISKVLVLALSFIMSIFFLFGGLLLPIILILLITYFLLNKMKSWEKEF